MNLMREWRKKSLQKRNRKMHLMFVFFLACTILVTDQEEKCFPVWAIFFVVGPFMCFNLIPLWSVQSDSLRPHGLQHSRPPCLSPTPGDYSNSCPLSRWCHPSISFSVVPFSSCLQSFPASGSFPVSRLFASGNQSIGVSASASAFPMNIRTDFL